jgi:ribonuclease R
MDNKTLEAKIIINSKSIGNVKNPILGEEDILIDTLDLNKSLSGDKVLIKLKKDSIDDNPRGIVVQIISRAREQFVGTIVKNNEGRMAVFPSDKKIHIVFILNDQELAQVKENQKVLIQMTDWPEDNPNPNAKLLKIFGDKNNHEVEMQSIVYDKGFVLDYPEAVLKEAEDLKNNWQEILKKEIAIRKDLRQTLTFTIDPVDAKDFDDALSFKKLENGNYEIGIHIADVSHFVTPDSDLDKEAFDRQFSVYLVDRTIPMLPEVLSNDLCSLNPNEEKLAFSTIFEISPNAEIISRWFGKTVIKSDKRFAYEEAQAVLDAQEGPLFEELNILNQIAKKLEKQKSQAGAINFEKDEIKFELDKDGKPIRILKKERLDAHKLIEEYMLLANREVAKYIFDVNEKKGGNDIGLMYRVHDVPNPEKISDLVIFLKALGYYLPIQKDGSVTAKDLNAILNQSDEKPEENLIKSAAIKTMSKAIYSTVNSGHFGLAFEYYTHFTSPIRRYPDLVVHRILFKFLNNQKLEARELGHLKAVAELSSEREIAAADAERESVKYKQCEFMLEHVGQEFEGPTSGVSKFGLFVSENTTLSDGMIHISKLGNDFFKFDEKNYAIYGEKSGKRFVLGDSVKIKIDKIDLDRRSIDMSLV